MPSPIYEFISLSPFQSAGTLAFCLEHLTSQALSPSRLQLLLLAQLRFVTADPYLPRRNQWRSSPLLQLAESHPDTGVRLLAIQCYIHQAHAAESRRREMEEKYLGGTGKIDADIAYGWRFDAVPGYPAPTPLTVDGWTLTLLEIRRIKQCKPGPTFLG